MHFLEIISADIVFTFCRRTHNVFIGGADWGAMTFKGASKEARRSHPPPKRPKMAQNHTQYNLVIACCQRQLSAIVLYVRTTILCLFFFLY